MMPGVRIGRIGGSHHEPPMPVDHLALVAGGLGAPSDQLDGSIQTGAGSGAVGAAATPNPASTVIAAKGPANTVIAAKVLVNEVPIMSLPESCCSP